MVLFSNSSWKVRVMPKVFKMFICKLIHFLCFVRQSMSVNSFKRSIISPSTTLHDINIRDSQSVKNRS